MAKLTKEELSARIDGLEIDEDVKISLMEDISDSISSEESSELESLRAEIETKVAEIEDLKRKYKERFMSAVEDKEEVYEETPEVEEKEVIDIKEI